MKGNRTYLVVLVAVVYLAGIKLGFWPADTELLAGLAFSAVAFLRAGFRGEIADHEERTASGARVSDPPEQGAWKSAPPSLLPLLAFLFAVAALSGCARFSTTQTDLSYENGQPARQITTRAKASTVFTAKSSLAQFKASQTDKTQSAAVGSLTQESNGTNAVAALEAIARILQALPK